MADENGRSAEEADGSGGSAEAVSKELSTARGLAEERLDQLMRCRAELDNVLKRAAREREESVRYASMKLVSRLLPLLDSLEQACKHDEGSRVLLMQMQDILSSEGLAPIQAVGLKFDPYRHEALYQVESGQFEEGTVVEEIQKGYLFNSQVIRFSKVAVAKR